MFRKMLAVLVLICAVMLFGLAPPVFAGGGWGGHHRGHRSSGISLDFKVVLESKGDHGRHYRHHRHHRYVKYRPYPRHGPIIVIVRDGRYGY
ncbi:MAG: hypothetical protein U1D31_01435 [Patescibacteria group bacterium]|nr:hypothetical protein [bacterium]MDZ4240770.1 hypothetical protein [Patescibacteria group bacterium]